MGLLLRLERDVKMRKGPNGERRTLDVYCGLKLSQARSKRAFAEQAARGILLVNG